MGDVKPWLWGKTHVLLPCCFVTLLVFPSSLVNLFNAQLVVQELWLREFIAEVVVVVEAVSLTQLPTPPTLPILHPHALFLGQFTLSPRFLVCWLLTHRLWAILVSRRHFLGLHELLKHPRTVIHVLAIVWLIHRKNRSCFLSRRGLFILTQRNRVCISRAFCCWV